MFIAPTLRAQIVQEFVATDRAASDKLGSAVTATPLYSIGGAPQDDNARGVDAGAVYVFNAVTGAQVRKIIGPDLAAGDQFGLSVAASGDYLVVGAPYHDGFGVDAGAAFLYRLSTGVMVRKLGSGVVQPGDNFGFSVSVWGDFVVVGAPSTTTGGALANGGAAHLYRLSSGAYLGLITATDASAGANFGRSVSINNHYIAIGAPNETRGPLALTGSVYVIGVQPDSGGISQLAKIFPTDATSNDAFGWAVAVNSNSLIVGAPYRTVSGNANAGRVTFYPSLSRTIAGSVPEYAFHPFNGFAAGDRSGASVALGDYLMAAGKPDATTFSATGAGQIEISAYHINGADPGAEVNYLQGAPDPHNAQGYGAALAISQSRVVIGAFGDGNNGAADAGALYQSPLMRPSLGIRGSTRFRTGQAAPGAAGGQFGSFKEMFVHPSSPNIVTLATLSGTGVNASNSKGAWWNPSSVTTKIGRTSDQALVGATITEMFGLMPGTSASHVIGFYRLAGPGYNATNNFALFTFDGTSFLNQLRLGDVVIPGVPTVSISSSGARATTGHLAVVPFAGKVGAGFANATNDSALCMNAVARREGTASSFGPGYGQFTRVATGNTRAIYAVPLQAPATMANNHGLETSVIGGAPTSIARKGDPAPPFGGVGTVGNYSAFLGESVNGSGFYVFKASLALGGTVTTANNEGLWANNGAGNALQLNLRKGDTPPGLAFGVKFARFLQYGIDSNGRILCLAQLSGTGITAANDLALVLSDSATYQIILREGEPAPGELRGTIGTLQRVDIDPYISQYAVLTSLVNDAGGVSAATNQMALVGQFGGSGHISSRRPTVLIAKGQRYVRTGADKVLSLAWPGQQVDSLGAMACGLGQALSGNWLGIAVQFSPADQELVQSFLALP